MQDTDLSPYVEALLGHPAVRQAKIVDGLLVIEAETASASWELEALPRGPDRLPIISLSARPLIGSLAHVNHSGNICYTDNEGVSVDEERLPEVLCEALSEALSTLDRALNSAQAGDLSEFDDELEGYWVSLPNGIIAPTHVDVDSLATREITVYVDQHKQMAFADKGSNASYGSYRRVNSDKNLIRYKGLYIPLRECIVPPTPEAPLSAAHVRTWAATARDPQTLQTLLKAWPRRVEQAFILFSQPRSDGSLSAFAVNMKARKTGQHPLVDTASYWTASPLRIQRHAPKYVRARGGAHDLSTRHIAIVGCGSVGSRVAELLAQSGVGTLTLVDPELLGIDNVYRHLLGSGYVGTSKARGLQHHLQDRLPGAQLLPVMMSLDNWLDSARLETIDGLIITVGNPNVERRFNREHWNRLRAGTPYVTAWLEPLGLGGHAQLSWAGQPACLECLYTDATGERRLNPKTAYTEPGQRISRDLTGCGSIFTPYGAVDAITTAVMASRLMLAALQGQETVSYCTWRGDSNAAAAANIVTTPWHGVADPVRAAKEYSHVRCPVCGGDS